MSKIDELIKEKCPNGVEYKRLKDLCNFQRGKSITIKNLEKGNYPVIAGGQNPAFYCNKFNRDDECITISSSGAYAGFINYWNEKILCTDSFSIISRDKNILNNKFLFHFLKSKQEIVYQKKKGAGIPHVHISDVDIMRIPVPPIEVQEEIVRILDKFSELEAELEVELEARKKQYEFWLYKLINRNDNVVELGSIGKISMCKRIMKNQTTENGDIPFYKIGTFGGKANAFISKELWKKYKENYLYPKKGDILISASGTIGKIVEFDGTPSYFQDSNIVWIENDETKVLNKYLYYFYQTNPWVISTGGTIARIYNDNIAKTKISIPSLDNQKKVINILDKFDKLVNDISEGIPAEIETRRKQYEYYRNKLLSFEELKK